MGDELMLKEQEGTYTDLSLTAEVKLYYDLYIPSAAGESSPLLLAVHGYGAHKRYMMREARLMAPPDFVIASVQAPYPHLRSTEKGLRVGFAWLTDHRPAESVELHQYFLNKLIEKLVSDGVADRGKVHLLGFSQACALNFRYAFTHPEVPASVIGICGGVPSDLGENPAYKPSAAKTLYLFGDDDEFYSNEKFAANDRRLRDLLPNYASKQFHAGHEITEEMRAEVRRFLKDLAG